MGLAGRVTGVLSSWCLITGALSASFPPTPEGVTVLKSTKYEGVSISYKETQICETTPGTKGYSGFVNLPPAPEEGRNYEVHTFFWFFESRNKPESSPLSLWLQGGPGSPSVVAALGENGPCLVNSDSKSTTLNPWSWNDKVNMLYIDQPVQTGFSYDTLVNGTIDEIKSPFVVDVQDFSAKGVPQTNTTFFTGTFSSQKMSAAPNATGTAAVAMWHFMQIWMQEFPQHKPNDNSFSIWAESYGGHYGPTFADYFEKQNKLIASGTIAQPATQFHLDTVGLVNACIDIDTQMPLYPEFAVNNTYGIKAINESTYQSAIASLGACRNLTQACRSLVDQKDPNNLGINADVNAACAKANKFCFDKIATPFEDSGLYHFDITTGALNSFPPKWAAGYLNTREVQLALGVPLNFTGNSATVATTFVLTGDFVKGHNLEILGNLLDRGVKVALMYGDRDYQCNWMGGEKISLAIQSKSATGFQKAGYANIQTNDSYVGGVVRQYGNLSFSRVFEAGHEVPYYQPATAYQIFNRVMFNTDVATGKQAINSNYSSSGPASVNDIKSTVPAPSKPGDLQCYVWDVMETCTQPQQDMLGNGSAIIRDFIMVGYRLPNGTEVTYGQSGPGGSDGGSNGGSNGAGGDGGKKPNAGTRGFGPWSALNVILAAAVAAGLPAVLVV